MKLKYYLRGIGIGVILTALIMGFALGGRKATISDAEVIERAKKLGMVQGGVLTDYSGEDKTNDNKEDSSSSASEVPEEGKEISKENDSEISLSGSPISEVVTPEESAASKASSQEGEKVADSSSKASLEENSKPVADAASKASSEDKAKQTDETSVKDKQSEKETTTSDTVAKDDSDNNEADTSKETSKQAQTSGETKTVTSPGGTSSDGVARILYNEGLIDDPVSFNKYLVDNRKDRIIRSGTKTFPVGASYEQIATIITK